MANITSSA
ncbi:hypothetical protein PENPOL_c028G10725 [Penicillium polonicum]|uniref:Uncharacterized protein n=1 Tax=Penicillium polonicum TaxID=60169 RepID=A0A1V6N5Z7_PENPO|nr:hypothetical protein PENPOL_c028G10725 [Penicillium polonicum]